METKGKDDLIPDQREGSKMDVKACRTFETTYEANAFFEMTCSRLLNINRWSEISGLSDFQLFDENGNKVNRKGQEGDYIRIDIPGPGLQSGDGFDWVKIEEIVHIDNGEEQLLSITVRPSAKPGIEKTTPAHFLKADATSTFIVRQQNMMVYSEEHGRNEMTNTDTESILDKGRNLLVGGAAKLGLSYPQWKLLIEGLIASNIDAES